MITLAGLRQKGRSSVWVGGAVALGLIAIAFTPVLTTSTLFRSSLSITVYCAILFATYLGDRIAGWIASVASIVGGLLVVTTNNGPIIFYLALAFLFELVIVEAVARMNAAQQRAEAAALENRTLFLELRHRVSNNLQMVASLLMLHEAVAHPEARRLFKEAATRIILIGKINRDLYEGGSTTVDAGAFLTRLCADLSDSLATSPIQCHIQAEGRWAAKTLGPLSIIIHELVANALEHGVQGKPDGWISVTFDAPSADRRRLTVEDNGHGIPPNFDPTTTKSLGLKLIRSFAHQIGTSVQFSQRNGGGTAAFLELAVEGTENLDEEVADAGISARTV